MSTLGRVMLLLITVVGVLSVPIVGVLLARVFDRWLGGNSIRLSGLGLLLAAVASTLLVLLPLWACCAQGVHYLRRSALEMDGWRAVGLGTIPVVTVAVPLLLELAVKPRLGRGPVASIGRILVVAVDAAAVLFLIGIMYLLSAALVGFLYLPATAALGAAAVRSWAWPGPQAKSQRETTARPVSG
jgi:hypothetical protein